MSLCSIGIVFKFYCRNYNGLVKKYNHYYKRNINAAVTTKRCKFSLKRTTRLYPILIGH